MHVALCIEFYAYNSMYIMVTNRSCEEKAVEFSVLNSDIWWDPVTAAPNEGGRESAQTSTVVVSVSLRAAQLQNTSYFQQIWKFGHFF